MTITHARGRRWFVAASILILWTGKLIPGFPAQRVDTVLGFQLILLGTWILVLRRMAWRGEADPLRGWRPRHLPIGTAVAIGAFVLAGVGYAISDRVLGFTPPAEAHLVAGGGARLLLLVGIALAAALLEEWIFRGVVLDRLRPGLGRAAIPASALCFAAYHLSPFQLLPTFLLGLVLAAVVVGLRSLWPAIVAHALFNVIGLALATVAPR